MKRKSISALALIIALVMLLVAAPAAFAANPRVRTGDIVTLGSYPQTRVSGEALLNQLGNTSPSWKSCGYYLNGAKSDYMQYADVTISGAKYRAVKFTQYRTYLTDYPVFADYSWQDDNGYIADGAVYWFKYEPVKWRVLDAAAGLIVTESLVDSQAFNNLASGAEWQTSTLRAWLNAEFYNTAFSSADKALIKPTALTEGVSDKVFILSSADATNVNYGFNMHDKIHDTERIARGTDYAEAQGLRVSTYATYEGNSYWWLRSGGTVSGLVRAVDTDGGIYGDGDRVNRTSNGVRPALAVTSLDTLTSYDGWVNDGTNIFYYENGTQVKNVEKTIDGVAYVFDNEGRVSGFKKDGVLLTEDILICLGGKIACLRSGNVVTGYRTVNGANRYFDKDGWIVADEEFITVTNGDTYYLVDSNAVTGYRIIGDAYIYNFGEDGRMHRNEANYDANGRLTGDIAALGFEVAPIEDKYFTGSPIEPATKVTFNGLELAKDVFYTVSYSDNTATGAAVVTVTGKGLLSGSINVNFNILPPSVAAVSLDRTFISMIYKQKNTEKLIAIVYPDNAGNKSVTWSSSDPSVASVDSEGNVTAHARGSTAITATSVDGGKTSTCMVTVSYTWWQWLIKILLFGWIWY